MALNEGFTLFNLDTGEEFLLGRSAKKFFNLPDNSSIEVVGISDLWREDSEVEIRNNPEEFIDLMKGLSLFLFASRRHRLVFLSNSDLMDILEEVFSSLGLDVSASTYRKFTRFYMPEDMNDFVQRRKDDLKEAKPRALINDFVIQKIKYLYKRKIVEKGLSVISDIDDIDYEGS